MTDNVRILRNSFYLIVLPLFLLQVRSSFFISLFRSPVFLATLAFLSYLWLSLFWSMETGAYVFYNEARTLVLMLLFLSVTAYYSSRIEHFTLLLSKYFAIIVGVTGIISLWWHYSTHSFIQLGGLESRAVAIGVFTYSLDSATTYGFVAVFLVFSLFLSRNAGQLFMWVASFSLLSILAFVGMTQSRGALLSIAVVVLLGLLWQRNKRLLFVVSVLAMVSVGIVLLSLFHPEGVVGKERSIAVRWEIWQSAMNVATERIWFGFGLNEHQKFLLSIFPGYQGLGYQGVAHSIYLENLIFGGIVGTLLLFLMAGLALRRALRVFAVSKDFLLPGLLFYTLLSGVFTGFLTLSKISPEWIHFWLPIGLIIGSEIRGQTQSALNMEQPSGTK
ncbi:O-antigen ligase family protein [Desulfonatronum thioautotrophicum]|uniref:O-antigen ligase family protein n=1 Tax=Desulfonatronum thioautotrophicum TaxID=617001 RepID=UPI001ABF52AA|nr:O-antigen ligase family protein [Desulfonatronum thioautotrophicum]